MPPDANGPRPGESFGAGSAVRSDASLITDEDLRLFAAGSHFRLWEKFGAHPATVGEEVGTHFTVWAPNARRVSVIGDFNSWRTDAHLLRSVQDSGVWQGFVPGVVAGSLYKYHIVSENGAEDKADPFAFRCEVPPATASVVCDLAYDWGDRDWVASRGRAGAPDAPVSIYELHLGSWLSTRHHREHPTYRQIADRLADHAAALGFTHVELMPVMEHPHYESWGYQITGFFAPTSRYGAPQDLMYLIDRLHQKGIGVILDWVPFHFPDDAHGLRKFDGSDLYERKGIHPRWTTRVFDYSRPQVVEFLLSNALFWFDCYHADALRVDAVSSIVYPDYPAEQEVPPDQARERLARSDGGVSFLRRFNDEVHSAHPGVVTIAEDSLSMPAVTGPASEGGLGFDMKWAIGWVHDTVDAYMTADPGRRPALHGNLTAPMLDLFRDRFVLPLSHDELQPGKGSLPGKMPGDEAARFANVRLFLAYMFAYPGKKLLFMGSEFAQEREWTVSADLEWALLEKPLHAGVRNLIQDLNRVYRREPALHELDFGDGGFIGTNCDDAPGSTISFLRRSRLGEEVAVVCNFSASGHDGYRIGLPRGGPWRAILSTDAREYGGGGGGEFGTSAAAPEPAYGQPWSLTLAVPPLAVVYLKPGGRTR